MAEWLEEEFLWSRTLRSSLALREELTWAPEDPRVFPWSCTLTGASKEFTWAPEDPADQDEDDESDPTVKPGHRLLIKNAVLMPSATADEVSLIQVETEGYNKTKVVVPFVAMMGGRDYNSYIDLLIPKKATFKLIQGEGPISLVGSHCVDFYGYR